MWSKDGRRGDGMRLIDADQMAADENEAYMNASLLVKDNVNSGINYVVHKKIQKLIADAPTADPVKPAHWIKRPYKNPACSECGGVYIDAYGLKYLNRMIPKATEQKGTFKC